MYLPCEYDDPGPSLRGSNHHVKIWPLTLIIWPLGQKFKIPLPRNCAGVHCAHSYVTIDQTVENCRRSLTKFKKMPKNSMFLTPVTLTLGQGQTSIMPGYSLFQDASTIAIKLRSDNGKVLKSWSHSQQRTDGQTWPSYIAEPKVSAKNNALEIWIEIRQFWVKQGECLDLLFDSLVGYITIWEHHHTWKN